MKWVTREKARVDRIACPWLISRFIDKEPTFLFLPSHAFATGFQAIAKDDHDNMTKQFPAYDALYAYCRARSQSR
jgi:hypothetical protein